MFYQQEFRLYLYKRIRTSHCTPFCAFSFPPSFVSPTMQIIFNTATYRFSESCTSSKFCNLALGCVQMYSHVIRDWEHE